jgi:hypothetical protein
MLMIDHVRFGTDSLMHSGIQEAAWGGHKMIDREYDLFEKDSDETAIWKCSVRGIIEAEEKVSLLALLTNREVFAMFVDTEKIVARANVARAN